jgi:hypothetical protein
MLTNKSILFYFLRKYKNMLEMLKMTKIPSLDLCMIPALELNFKKNIP